MWLLNVATRELESFDDENRVGYAILSHTWGVEEVTFADMKQSNNRIDRTKKGHVKIDFTCEQASKDDLKYVWIDTCGTTRPRSAMRTFLISRAGPASDPIMTPPIGQLIDACDVAALDTGTKANDSTAEEAWAESVLTAIQNSRWFTRGWTLQELIAPSSVKFYNVHWDLLGDKLGLLSVLPKITGIDIDVLEDRRSLPCFSIAKRMSWAANRHTTRVEDQAYSLMGMFDVNMPMLYGEGKKAFTRLQEEIIKTSIDHSIFAWQPWDVMGQTRLLLSPGPFGFRHAGNIDINTDNRDYSLDTAYSMINVGLRIVLATTDCSVRGIRARDQDLYFHARLNCYKKTDHVDQRIWLPMKRLRPMREGEPNIPLCEVDRDSWLEDFDPDQGLVTQSNPTLVIARNGIFPESILL